MTAKEFAALAMPLLSQRFSQRESSQMIAILLEDICGITSLESTKKIEDQIRMENAVEELLDHKPLQYITGVADFYGLKYQVNEHVLIPRPETEELVRWVLEDHSDRKKLMDVLDIGTGSGCIALTLAKKHRYMRLTAAEISKDALNIARINSRKLSVQLSFALMDITDEGYWDALGIYDIIVSNPPYIRPDDRDMMGKSVLDYEPDLALYAGDDPLVFYRVIEAFSQKHLSEQGAIYLEVHEDLAEEVAALFVGADVTIQKDMQGKDRMVRAQYQ